MRIILAAVIAFAIISPAHANPIGSAVGGESGTQSSLDGGLCLLSPIQLTDGQQAGLVVDCKTHALITTPAAGGTILVPINTATSTDVSGQVTVGGTYQTVVAANSSRKNCTIQNPTTATEVLNVKLGAMANPYTLSAGAVFKTLSGNLSSTDAISITAATTGHAWAGTCQN